VGVCTAHSSEGCLYKRTIKNPPPLVRGVGVWPEKRGSFSLPVPLLPHEDQSAKRLQLAAARQQSVALHQNRVIQEAAVTGLEFHVAVGVRQQQVAVGVRRRGPAVDEDAQLLRDDWGVAAAGVVVIAVVVVVGEVDGGDVVDA
jgi:hypothetical protein